MSSSNGERWFWRLVGLTAVTGGVWHYTWLLPGPARWLDAFVALLCLIVITAWAVRARDVRRGVARRAAQLERDLWAGTLPGDEPRPVPEPGDRGPEA